MHIRTVHGSGKERERISEIVIDIPPETYKRLELQAHRAGKAPEAFTRELVENALMDWEQTQPQTAREILESLGHARRLSETLRRKIIPGLTLDEVREALTHAAGPSLSEIVLEQRGPRP